MMTQRRNRQHSTRSPRFPVRALLIGALLAGCTGLLDAQQPSSPPERPGQIRITPQQAPIQLQPNSDASVSGDPYWRETVEKAIDQYQSENPDVRRSAVMLLGKYPVPPARETVAQALKDPDAGVRQAALVSALEEQTQINGAFRGKLLPLLADPEVSIRRIASSSLPMIVHSYPFVLHPGTGQMERQLPGNAKKILQAAFRDDDVSVRRNMVDNYPLLRIDLPQETVISLLHDTDVQVAVHSLSWGLALLEPPTLKRELESLVRHESETFRLELARALQSRPIPEALEALGRLVDDPSPAVALEAMLASFQHRPSVELYEKMVELYRDQAGASDVGQRVIFAAQMLGDRGEPYLREWLADKNPAHRQQAARVYLSRFAEQAETGFLLSLLEDPVQEVRLQAVRALMQTHERLTAEHVRQLISSRHTDVRRSAAGLTRFLPTEAAEGILLDLLLDNERDVQLAALQQIGQRRIEGWEEIMGITLEVDDPITSRTAVEWLMRNPTPKTLKILRAYRKTNPNTPWRPQIDAHLKRHQPSEPS